MTTPHPHVTPYLTGGIPGGPATTARPVPRPTPDWAPPPVLRAAPCALLCRHTGPGLASVRLVGGPERLLDGAGGACATGDTDRTDRTGRAGAPGGLGWELEALGAAVRTSPGLLALDLPGENLRAALDTLAHAAAAPPLPGGRPAAPGERGDAATARHRLLTALCGESHVGALVVVTGEGADVHGHDLAGYATALGLCEPPLPPRPPRFPPTPARVHVRRDGSAPVRLAVGYGVPGRSRTVEWAALTVAARVLGGGLAARLNRLLREEKGVTYGFTCTLEPVNGAGVLLVEGTVRAEAAQAALGDVLSVLRGPASGGISAAECAAAVRAELAGAWTRYETAAALADELASLAAEGLGPEQLVRHRQAVRGLDAATVSAVLTRELGRSEPTVIAAGGGTLAGLTTA